MKNYKLNESYYDPRRIIRNSEATGKIVLTLVGFIGLTTASKIAVSSMGFSSDLEQTINQIAMTAVGMIPLTSVTLSAGEYIGNKSGEFIYKMRRFARKHKVIHIEPTEDHPNPHYW